VSERGQVRVLVQVLAQQPIRVFVRAALPGVVRVAEEHLPDGCKADTVAAALVEHMATLPTHLRRSLTWDRGREMASHATR